MQASEEELKLFTSIAEVHAQKFKDKLADTSDKDGKTADIIRGSNKLKTVRQKNKVDLSDDEDEDGAQSEVESIDTSDISTDEEDEKQEDKKMEKSDTPLAGADTPSLSQSQSEEATSSAAREPETKAPSTQPVEAKTDGKAAVKQMVKPTEPKPAVHIPVNRKPEIQVGASVFYEDLFVLILLSLWSDSVVCAH